MKETETETETEPRAMYDIGDGLRAECVGVGYLDGETMSIVDTACWELYLDEKPLIAKFVQTNSGSILDCVVASFAAALAFTG